MCCRGGDCIQSAFQRNGRDYGGFKVSAYLPGFKEISKAMLGVCGGLAECEAQVRFNKNASASVGDRLQVWPHYRSRHGKIKSVDAVPAVTVSQCDFLQIYHDLTVTL